MKFAINDRMINYQIDGSGEDLLLIHGFGDNLNVWYDQVPVFSKNFRVIRYDLPGSGESDISAEENSIGALAGDAYSLLKDAGANKVWVLGHSLGGLVACRLVLNHPEMINGLILANSIPVLPVFSQTARKSSRRMLELLEQGDIKTTAELMVETSFSPDFKCSHPDEFQSYLKIKLMNNPAGLVRLLKCRREPLDLGSIECPAMVVLGEKDIFIGAEEMARTQELLPHLQSALLPCGHASFLELPEEFNTVVLKFLYDVQSTHVLKGSPRCI